MAPDRVVVAAGRLVAVADRGVAADRVVAVADRGVAVADRGVAPAGVVASVRAAATMPYRPPLAAVRVLRAFAPPADLYGAGHRGVDLAASAGVAVLAAGSGVVRFAGSVAGRGVVVLAHPDGISTEYEPVAAVVAPGQRVAAGQRIGSVRGAHRGCPPAGCLPWRARRGNSSPPAYLDPMSLLRPLGVVRLLPW